MKRKIIILGMALVMLFSVSFFGAGRCVLYDPERTVLLNRIEELERRLEEFERIEKKYSEFRAIGAADFEFLISLSNYTFYYGENIQITASIKNATGMVLRINYDQFMVWPIVIGPYYDDFDIMPIDNQLILEIDEIIYETHYRGSRLPRGEHLMVAYASFSFSNPELALAGRRPRSITLVSRVDITVI